MSKESKDYKNMPKKIYIRTFGCQMNERDSEWVMGGLLEKGFEKADSPNEADIIIYNTCSVRKHAEDRAISNMGQLARLKKKNPKMIMGLMGCTAEYHQKELFERLPHIDFVCGTNNIHLLFTMMDNIMKKKERQMFVGRLKEKLPEINADYRGDKKKASVSISRGCNNFCTYCIVPYVRGPERSRSPQDIINEIGDLLSKGYVNITLLGQNVNSYGRDLNEDIDFVGLLKAIDRIEGKKNINFLTSHPRDASIELFEAMKNLKGLSKHLHLPVQSGSDKILKAMNRGYDLKYYLSKIKYFKKIVPNYTLTTDIIVGFPGETKEDYGATKNLLKEVEFDAAYIFKYSPRPPASSSKIEDNIPKDVKQKRHRELLEMQKSISKRKRKEKNR